MKIIGNALLFSSLFCAAVATHGLTPRPPGHTSHITSGIGALSQQETNGNSLLGTLNAPKYGPYLGADSRRSTDLTPPWGVATVVNPNTVPNTGVTRNYQFTLSRATIQPDGVPRDTILVNGAFPGPPIEANWGDTIVVNVTNAITSPTDGATIHWHGMLQNGTNWMDGIPGVTGCPIAPGTSFVYTFSANQYGTTFYHSHYGAQAAGGVFGAFTVYGPQDNAEYNIDLGPVFLTDWYHVPYQTIIDGIMSTNLTLTHPQSINNLINGKGSFNCSLVPTGTPCTPNAGYSKFQLTPGKTHRLRLINAGAEAIQKFSLDGHQLTVMALDLVPIVPFNTTVVTLGVGQRADVLVYANHPTVNNGAVWMRSTISSCSLTVQPYAYGMVYYQGANTNLTPQSTAWNDTTDPCANDDLTTSVPAYPIAPPLTASVPSQDLTIGFALNASGNLLWSINNSSFRIDYNDPVMMNTMSGKPYDPDWNVYDFGTATSMRFVIYNPPNDIAIIPVAHPLHLHGHNFYVLASGYGYGAWNGTITNSHNPTRRDTHILVPNGFVVLQIDMNNPGVWPLHCHIAWHVSTGFAWNVVDNAAKVKQFKLPQSVTNACTAWNAWTSKDVVDQIDSGL